METQSELGGPGTWPAAADFVPGLEGTRPICLPGEANRFWIARRGITYETTFPDKAGHYLDTNISDDCTRQDFTIGLLHPTELEAGFPHTVTIVAYAGTEASSEYVLSASRLVQYPQACPFWNKLFCVGLNPRSGGQDLLVGRDMGRAGSEVSCLDWRRGDAVQPTLCPPPVPQDPPLPDPPDPPDPTDPPAPNRPPTIEAGPSATGREGSATSLAGAASDPEGDPLDIQWKMAPLAVDRGTSCFITNVYSLSTTVTCNDDGLVLLTLVADDGVNPPVQDVVILTLSNVAPTVQITAPANGVLYGADIHPVTIRASYADPGTNDSHTCSVSWGDGNQSAGMLDPSARTCTATHMYTTPGDRAPAVEVADDDVGLGAGSVQIGVRDSTISGGAFAAKVEMSGQPPQPPTVAVDLPPEGGGPYTRSAGSLDLPGILQTGALAVSTEGRRSGSGAFVRSGASQATSTVGQNLALLQTGSSQCRTDSGGSTGSAPLARLELGGTTLIDLSPAPNTTMAIPGGTLILNEQIVTTRPAVHHPLGGFVSFGASSITVNGAHLVLSADSSLGAGDIILSQTQCALEGPALSLP